MYTETTFGPKRGVSLYSYSGEFGFEKMLAAFLRATMICRWASAAPTLISRL